MKLNLKKYSLEEKDVTLARPVLDALIEELMGFTVTADDKQTRRDTYDTADWPFFQAHMNGEKAAYKRLINILKVK